MTNTAIDNVIDLIGDTHDQIDALDSKKTKTRTDLNERLRLVRQLAALEKQFRAFGKRGTERKKFREDLDVAYFIVLMDVHDPAEIAKSRAFLAKHDPALLQRMDAATRDDEYQEMRFKTIIYMTAEQPEAVAFEYGHRFFDSIRDADGNLPAWTARLPKETPIPNP